MEWASSGAMQPQTDSMEPSEYISTVGWSREADVCFKVRRDRASPSPALDSRPLQCNQTGHWASGDCFSRHILNLFLTAAFQIARTLLVRANRSVRKVPRRAASLALAISVARKVTGPMVRCGPCSSCTTVADSRVACPNPDGGTSKTKSRTTTRTTSTSKRGAKTTRSTSGSSTRGGKGTRGKKAASKFAAADEW